MRYQVQYAKTDHYLVTVDADSEDEALEAAEQAIERADKTLVDISNGEIEFESINEDAADNQPVYGLLATRR
jgi:translation initiation factor 2 alpha subunit (eIF-2alpha)